MCLRRASVSVILCASAWVASCAYIPLSARASYRMEQYLSTHQELLPSVLDAIRNGHVVVGMDREQVVVVLGVPVKTATYRRDREVEVWIYPGHRLHQDQMRGDKAWLFRLVFIDDVLRLIEPI